ncbi:MAG: nucleotide exchange factor GrpE [Myxococcota bacterium]
MSHPAQPPTSEGTAEVKVNDRRRFHEDGTPRDDARDATGESKSTSEEEVHRLQQELEAARKRIDELARAYQAGERDREEFKKRVAREREQLMDVERGKVALALLEAIDELDLALSTAVDSPLKQGVRLVRENLLKKAEATGIEAVPLEGQAFDPNLAEATDMEVTAVEADDGKVVAVTRAAYALKGRVIRPGQVKVARYVKPAQA